MPGRSCPPTKTTASSSSTTRFGRPERASSPPAGCSPLCAWSTRRSTNVVVVIHVLKSTYTQPSDVVEKTRPAHLEFLNEEIAAGGPPPPRGGGGGARGGRGAAEHR